MKIKQVTDLTGLSAKQIRDYEKHQLLPKVARTEAGYRDYDKNDVERLKFIHHAREVGFSIAHIKTLLLLWDNPSNSQCREVKQLTHEHLQFLTEKIAQLDAMRQKLQNWYDRCAGDENADCAILDQLNP
ncbi:Cu(I)-responsive transcriptional regulator [Haemophilus paracuniculus]|uniref:Cu(I)-responsive transcriptional regulator n=1 Tax=Haemophilus paracuniculus TaxID=734 RepID=A0A1T0AQV2_9PAST|nr:MerR family DNA-binding protein [Haemophilus paracuniculus]OOR98316.1 Cu(I)-responsive transcriptional regulator [Haemophilus paracuniculus]